MRFPQARRPRQIDVAGLDKSLKKLGESSKSPAVPKKIIMVEHVDASIRRCRAIDKYLAETSTEPKKPKRKRQSLPGTLSQRLRAFDELMERDGDPYITAEERAVVEETLEEYERVFAAQRMMLQKQQEYIDAKPAADTKPIRGKLYLERQAKNFKEDFGEPRQKEIHKTSYSEIMTLRFRIKPLLQTDKDIFITLADDAELVVGDNWTVGYNELKLAFLSSPGVDPKLLHEKWLENAYFIIAIHLMWLDNNFEQGGNVFTAERVLLELKYFYDLEIDLSERPAIRMITELDEVPQRRMVLKVHSINFIAKCGYELELSDGRYKIPVVVDSCIANMIDEKKIERHTRLMISHAILMNPSNEGCHPLDAPDAMKLKIYGNSTRVTEIESKLGFCETRAPFHIPLDSVSGSGGVIAELKLYVTHVYPIVYVASNGEKKSKFLNIRQLIF